MDALDAGDPVSATQGEPQYLGVFEEAWGVRPSTLVKSRGGLTPDLLEKLVGPYGRWAAGSQRWSPPARSIWPLISHHNFQGGSKLRGGGLGATPEQLSAHTTSHLLFSDGLLLGDPLGASLRASLSLNRHERARGLAEFSVVLGSLAALEPLLSADLIRVVPNLAPGTSGLRDDLFAHLGAGAGMQTVVELRQRLEFEREDLVGSATVQDLNALIARWDPWLAPVDTEGGSVYDTCLGTLETLGQALIEVSWQLAEIAAMNGTPDPYLVSHLELAVFQAGLEHAGFPPPKAGRREIGIALDQGRFLRHLTLQDMPRFRAGGLSVDDLTAIRRDGFFEEWRRALHWALDEREVLRRSGLKDSAEDAVSDALRRASADVREGVRRSSFLGRAREGSFEFLLMSVLGFGFAASEGALLAGASGPTTALALALWRWIKARPCEGEKAFVRHVSAFVDA